MFRKTQGSYGVYPPRYARTHPRTHTCTPTPAHHRTHAVSSLAATGATIHGERWRERSPWARWPSQTPTGVSEHWVHWVPMAACAAEKMVASPVRQLISDHQPRTGGRWGLRSAIFDVHGPRPVPRPQACKASSPHAASCGTCQARALRTMRSWVAASQPRFWPCFLTRVVTPPPLV